MKKAVFILFLILTIGLTAYGQQYDSENDFKVTQIDNGRSLMITQYVGNKKELNIPPQIQGKPVTRIMMGAFQGKSLTSVSIPNSVISIGYQAFTNNQLTSVTIGKNVELGEGGNRPRVFDDALFETKYIGEGKIAGTYSRNSVNGVWNRLISPEQAELHRQASELFGTTTPAQQGANSGTSQTQPAQQYDPESDFMVYPIFRDEDNRMIVEYLGRNQIIHIPPRINGGAVKQIASNVFKGKGITSVTIPNGVTVIANEAFRNNKLTKIIIPNSVTEIWHYVFYENQLNSITIGANVFLGTNVFDGNFDTVYNNGGKRAGTYVLRNGTWVRQ